MKSFRYRHKRPTWPQWRRPQMNLPQDFPEKSIVRKTSTAEMTLVTTKPAKMKLATTADLHASLLVAASFTCSEVSTMYVAMLRREITIPMFSRWSQHITLAWL